MITPFLNEVPKDVLDFFLNNEYTISKIGFFTNYLKSLNLYNPSSYTLYSLYSKWLMMEIKERLLYKQVRIFAINHCKHQLQNAYKEFEHSRKSYIETLNLYKNEIANIYKQ